MVPLPQIYIARAYLKNVAGLMSILNIKGDGFWRARYQRAAEWQKN
jgi:hypothetical protein